MKTANQTSETPKPEGARLRVLFVDDHLLVRRGLRRLLADAMPSAHFGEVANVTEALQAIREHPWDLIVLDLNMPGRSGLDLLKEMKQVGSTIPVLVLSVHSEEQYAMRSLKAGAAGYLSKDSAPEQFVNAVERILSGRPYISATVAEKLAADFRGSRAAKSIVDRLSDRELEVLRLIGVGKTVKEIAGQLSLSVKTVSTYRVRLLAKLGMKTNAEMMRFAMEERLVE